jgi:hypothetical protein
LVQGFDLGEGAGVPDPGGVFPDEFQENIGHPMEAFLVAFKRKLEGNVNIKGRKLHAPGFEPGQVQVIPEGVPEQGRLVPFRQILPQIGHVEEGVGMEIGNFFHGQLF